MKEENTHLKRLEKDGFGQFLPDLLVEEVMDDLEMEEAVDWLSSHLDSDRVQASGKHVYSTTLFSITVDYSTDTVVIAAELGCHPQDEILDLHEFASVLARRLATNSGGVFGRKSEPHHRGHHDFRHDILPS